MKLGRRIRSYFFFISAITLTTTITMNTITATSSTKMQKSTCSRDWPGLKLRLLAFDFDGTCTVQDTTGLYYKATETYRSGTDAESQIIDKQWESLGNTYLRGHKEIIKRLLEKVNPNSNDGRVNIEGLKSFLMETHNFDSESSKNVEASGILSGISKEGIVQIAKKVQLRPSCLQVLGQINLPLNVISFNWSKDLIQIVLAQLKHLRIAGNNFPMEDNKSTGKIDDHVSTSFDKESEFLKLVEGDESEGPTVYIGDSIGDLLPLLKADVGIIIGNSNTLRKVAKTFGIKLLPILDLYNHREGYCSMQCDSSTGFSGTFNNNGVLYEANGWHEVGELLLGNRLQLDQLEIH